MDGFERVVVNAQTPTGGVFILAVLIIVAFVIVARRVDSSSPLAPHVLPFAAMMVVLPATMFLGVTKTIDSNAVSAILASMVAYFFSSRPLPESKDKVSERPQGN